MHSFIGVGGRAWWLAALPLLLTSYGGAGQGRIFVGNSQTGVVGAYTTNGTTLNASLITGLGTCEGIAVDGEGYLYVASENGTIGKYTTTGSVVNRALISGLFEPWAIALDGKGHLFVANYGGSVGEYTTSGEVVNPALISGLASPVGIALDGKGHLFVSNYGLFQNGWIGSIGEYTTSGKTVNANLIPDLKWNWGIVVAGNNQLFVVFNSPLQGITEYTTSGTALTMFNTGLGAPTAITLNEAGHLLVADDWLGRIGEYTTAGETINSNLISGLHGPRGVAVAIPPNSLALAQGDQTVEAGSTVRLAVACGGTPPLTYHWYVNQTNSAGAPSTSPVLELADIQSNQLGAYVVVITNAFGAVTSPPCRVSVIPPVPRRMVPAIHIAGQAGTSLNLDFSPSLDPATNWTSFAQVAMTNTAQFHFDLTASEPAQRFYRAWQSNSLAAPARLNLNFVPALTLNGAVGESLQLHYINAFGPTDAWVTLAAVTLTNTSQLYFDTSAIHQPPRLYRVLRGAQ